MHTVLLTWNPGQLDDHIWTPTSWDDAMVVPHLEGRTVETTWSVGRHVNNIEPGDAAFLYRQGAWGRGMVARGIIGSHPWQAPHWQNAGETANHVDVEWQESVPISLALDVDELEMLIPDFRWRQIYSSGRQTPSGVGRRLALAWAEHAEHVRVATPRGTGSSGTPGTPVTQPKPPSL